MRVFLTTLVCAAGFAVGAQAATCSSGSGGNSLTATLDMSSTAECYPGNDTPTIDSSFSVFGMSGWVLAAKNDGADGDGAISYTDAPANGSQSGSWGISSVTGFDKVMVTLKAGNHWGSFLVDTLSGTWSTSKGLSHSSIYYIPGTTGGGGGGGGVVPLPAAGWMLLAGLGGLAAFRRKS